MAEFSPMQPPYRILVNGPWQIEQVDKVVGRQPTMCC